ncbi:MAG: J domain-containing protein [Alphaproteobacteria bacterium]|nr:J domain-containing protein [Alphaproteobacteria bacterium]
MDYYKTLGVQKNATQDEIKKAFRSLAQKHHPDKGGSADQFKKINEAYQTLGDTEKRKKYDQFGSNYSQYQQNTHSDFSDIFGQGFSNVEFDGDPGDIFNMFFGGGRRSTKGKNISMQMNITFQEAMRGTKKSIHIPYRTKKEETLTVTIPIGVSSGERLRVRDKGEESKEKGGPPGDLFISLNVSPHPFLKYDRGYLIASVPITLSEALLGCEKKITGIDNEQIKIAFKEGTRHGEQIVISYGVVSPYGTGKTICIAEYVYPKKLSSKAKEALKILQSEGL